MNWIYTILTWITNNSGYETQPQRRFKVGDVTTISRFIRDIPGFSSGTIVRIVNTAAFDYVVQNEHGVEKIVYQHELDWDNRQISKIDKSANGKVWMMIYD